MCDWYHTLGIDYWRIEEQFPVPDYDVKTRYNVLLGVHGSTRME